jgi:monoamine oxidase
LTRLHDFWKQLDTVMRRLDARKADRSFADFLDDAPGGPSAADARSLARMFVEGFHAADARRISAKALADGGSPGENPDEQRQLRVADGYDRVPEWLARELRDRILTEAVVERVEWAEGAVEITTRPPDGTRRRISARAVIVTVPLGVLLASPDEPGSIAFSPRLTVLDRVRQSLTMGAVTKVTLVFRERWWTDRLRSAPRDASLESMSFLHGDAEDLPVWWSVHPVHAAAMIGWAGGPAGLRMSGLSPTEMESRAVRSLATTLGVSRRRVSSQLKACWTHDWQHDPFSRGAYSYALVGGADAASQLSRSIKRTLWLAGEAADPEGRNGTVHGAIGSGRGAAQSVMRALARQAR